MSERPRKPGRYTLLVADVATEWDDVSAYVTIEARLPAVDAEWIQEYARNHGATVAQVWDSLISHGMTSLRAFEGDRE